MNSGKRRIRSSRNSGAGSEWCFQAFNLFPHLTVLENVMLFPVSVHHVPKDEAKKKALEILDRVGLADKAN